MPIGRSDAMPRPLRKSVRGPTPAPQLSRPVRPIPGMEPVELRGDAHVDSAVDSEIGRARRADARFAASPPCSSFAAIPGPGLSARSLMQPRPQSRTPPLASTGSGPPSGSRPAGRDSPGSLSRPIRMARRCAGRRLRRRTGRRSMPGAGRLLSPASPILL